MKQRLKGLMESMMYNLHFLDTLDDNSDITAEKRANILLPYVDKMAQMGMEAGSDVKTQEELNQVMGMFLEIEALKQGLNNSIFADGKMDEDELNELKTRSESFLQNAEKSDVIMVGQIIKNGIEANDIVNENESIYLNSFLNKYNLSEADLINSTPGIDVLTDLLLELDENEISEISEIVTDAAAANQLKK